MSCFFLFPSFTSWINLNFDSISRTFRLRGVAMLHCHKQPTQQVFVVIMLMCSPQVRFVRFKCVLNVWQVIDTYQYRKPCTSAIIYATVTDNSPIDRGAYCLTLAQSNNNRFTPRVNPAEVRNIVTTVETIRTGLEISIVTSEISVHAYRYMRSQSH